MSFSEYIGCPIQFSLIFHLETNHLLFFIWYLMSKKYKDVSAYSQLIRTKMNTKRMKSLVGQRSLIELFLNNSSLHHSPIKGFDIPKEEHIVLKA